MKKFQFSLDSVLSYKQQVLEGIQNEYAALTAKVRQQEERVRAVRQRYADLNQEFREKEAFGMTIVEARRYESGLRFLEMEIQREETLLKELREQAEAKRRELVAARQDTATIEKLKEKKLEDYRKSVQKSEEQFIDELVSAQRATANAS